MAYEQNRMRRPLSRLELALSVVLLSIFISYFLHRILIMTVAAEDRYLMTTINQIRAELMIYSAEKLIEHRYEDLYRLSLENPVGRGFQAPRNYAGSRKELDLEEMAPGSWWYEENTGSLVYRVTNEDYFRNHSSGLPLLRLGFELGYEDRDTDGLYTPGADSVRGVSLRVLDQYSWNY